KESKDVYKAYSDEYADEQDEDYQKKLRIERQVFFKSSLAATNIVIRRNKLSFHSYECARDGLAKPGSEFNKDGCSTILSVINLANVTVSEKEFKEKVFFGNKQILVEGDVTNKIIGGMEGLSDYDAKVLNDKIIARIKKNKGSILIPVKPGLNFTYALDTFREIVAFHRELNKDNQSNNLGGKLDVDDLNFDKQNDYIDVDDLNFDKQNDYIIEKEDNKLKFSNDNDDSINETLVFDDLNDSVSGENIDNTQIPETVFD
ncbi:hypothetical protein N9W73_00230, partial [Gammaproteobacteria bacterium]|nr:hypothetical protein [Gammaproteobacteria bacterium]